MVRKRDKQLINSRKRGKPDYHLQLKGKTSSWSGYEIARKRDKQQET